MSETARLLMLHDEEQEYLDKWQQRTDACSDPSAGAAPFQTAQIDLMKSRVANPFQNPARSQSTERIHVHPDDCLATHDRSHPEGEQARRNGEVNPLLLDNIGQRERARLTSPCEATDSATDVCDPGWLQARHNSEDLFFDVKYALENGDISARPDFQSQPLSWTFEEPGQPGHGFDRASIVQWIPPSDRQRDHLKRTYHLPILSRTSGSHLSHNRLESERPRLALESFMPCLNNRNV